MTPLLDEAALERYVESLRAQGPPVVDHLTPGLSQAEIDELCTEAELSLPDEARVWWRFSNGVPVDAPEAAQLIGPEHEWCSLQWAIAERDVIIANLAEHLPPEEILWRPTWLPWVGTHRLALDVSGQPIAVVRPVDFHARAEEQGSPIDSLGTLVAAWTTGLQTGLTYDAEDEVFDVDLGGLNEVGLPDTAF